MAELQDIMSALESDDSGVEKTASTSAGIDVAEQALSQAVTAALDASANSSALSGVKEASADESLLKIASDMASADDEAIIKQAQVFGAAFADGAMARFGQYDDATEGVKTASDDGVAGFEKWASENPEEFQANFEEGYREVELEKLASTPEGMEKIAAYDDAYNNTTEELVKIASAPGGVEQVDSYQAGFVDTMAQLEKIASEHDGAEKIASLRAGYAYGIQNMVKQAQDTYDQGRADTIELLKHV